MKELRHIVITGASSGIGAALALAYAAPDVCLSVAGRDSVRLASIRADAEKRGATVFTRSIDVTDAPAMAAWIAACDQIAPIDLLIANAGISANSMTDEASDAVVRHVFDVNFTGMLNTVHPVLPLMKKRGSGQIALMSSLAGFRGSPKAGAYCASKAAVRFYGEALRPELAAYGVDLSVVCPGFIKTPLTDRNNFTMPFLISAEKAARIIQKGLASNKPRIAFPFGTRMIVALYSALPLDLAGRCMMRLPEKKARGL